MLMSATKTIHMHPAASHSQPTDGPAQADRLLKQMHQVCSHDLPNQLVVLQSLLELLSLEESADLGDEGREYVRRLQNATRHASGMVRFLKEMASLKTRVARMEPIALSQLGRELQGGLRHLYPERRFVFEWDWRVPTFVGDARLYVQAILELFAGLSHFGAEQCRLSASAQDRADRIELAFHIKEILGPDAAAAPFRPRALHEHLEIILAREWLAICRAGLEVLSADGAEARFLLIVPNR
jgi:light-regulated signal transduction histidine kinase (bacteriophytochrome)